MAKKLIINTLKFLLAGGLIYWLVQSGKLEMSFVTRVFEENPLRVAAALAFILIDQCFVAVRLRIIMMAKASEALSFIKLILINWIGIFFNAVLPGSVTGDLVKIFYINDLDKKLPKNFIFLGVFFDRVIGLIALVTVGSIFSIINYNELTSLSSEVAYLIHLNLLIFTAIILAGFLFVFFNELPLKISAKLKPFPVFNKIMPICDHVWETFTLFRSRLPLLFCISLLIQFLAILIFWFLVSPFSEGAPLSFAQTAAILPMGFIGLAIPIAPSGLGVGHALFGSLLGFYGITNGANLFNLYFVVVMLSNISGAIPYLLYSTNQKMNLKDIRENS